jgi:arabinogalactan endo-1,4-beta-galactosidase
MKNGNSVAVSADAIEDVTLIIDLNGDVVLPDKVNAIMTDNSKQEISVEWKKMAKVENYTTGAYTDIDFAAMKAAGIAKYDIVGEAGGMEAHCYVSMVEYNFLQNWSFEDDATGTGWVATPVNKFDELYVEDKATDSITGTKHYHFWGASSVEFTLEQTVENLKAGKYNYTISIMGGDGGNTEIYSYVKINGEIVKTADLTITVYNEWHTATISGFDVAEGDVVTVGIYVKCAGAGNGPWGKIDDAMLNSVK